MDPAACSACSLLALGRRDGEPLHWGHPGLPLAFPLRPLAPLHPGKGRGGEAGAVPCSQRSLNARCGDLVLVPQEHRLGAAGGLHQRCWGGDLIQGRWDGRSWCPCSGRTSGRVFHLPGLLQVWWKVFDPAQAALGWALL